MLDLDRDKTVTNAFFNGDGTLVLWRKFPGNQEKIDRFYLMSRSWIKNPPKWDL